MRNRKSSLIVIVAAGLLCSISMAAFAEESATPAEKGASSGGAAGGGVQTLQANGGAGAISVSGGGETYSVPGDFGGGGVGRGRLSVGSGPGFGAPNVKLDLNMGGSVPEKLEDALDAALRNNPDLQLAQANVRAAEAQLNKVRLEVVRDVSQTFSKRQNMKEAVAKVERESAAGKPDVKALSDAKMAQAESDAKLQYLLGLRGPTANTVFELAPRAGLQFFGTPAAKEMKVSVGRPVLAPKALSYYKILETSISVDLVDSSVLDECELLRQQYNLNIVADPEAASMKIRRLNLKEVPMMQVLQAMVESNPAGLCILFRDYGVLVTTQARAELIAAPSIPPNIPLYVLGKTAPIAGAAAGGTVETAPAPPAAAPSTAQTP